MSKSLEDWRSREAVIDELIVSKHWLRHQADEWLRTAINTGKLLPRTRLIQTPLIEAPWIPIDGAKIRLTPIDDYSGQPLEIVEINLTEVFQVLEGAPVAPTPLMATGLPGRPPKGRDQILREFRRRMAETGCKPSLSDEASELGDWFREKYQDAPQPTTKTIKNNIRSAYRDWKTSQKRDGP